MNISRSVVALCLAIQLPGCGGSSSAPPAYTIGGTTGGLSGTVVLENNGKDDLSLTTDGVFHFATALQANSSYAVTVKTQPANQLCTVTSGGGVVSGANVTSVVVDCTNTYAVGGMVSGLKGTVVLQDNGASDLSVNSNGSFTFGGAKVGTSYEVTVKSQPMEQQCSVANASGTLSANVTNVSVACVTLPLTLTGSSPSNGGIDLSRTGQWILTFSAGLDATTVNANSVSLASATGSQPISVNASGNQLAIASTTPLLPLTVYTLTVSNSIRGSIGEQLPAPVVLSATSADRTWQAPVAIEADISSHQAFGPTLAIDPSGDVLVAWYQYDGSNYNIWSNWYRTPSGWGSPTLVQANGLGSSVAPQLGFDSNGDALAIWEQGSTPNGLLTSVGAKRYDANSGWGTATTIGSGAGAPQLGVDANGNAVAVWFTSDGTRDNVWANRFTPSTGWGSATIISTGTSSADFPQVAMDAAGTAFSVWYQVGAAPENIWANQFIPGAGWSGATIIQSDQTVSASGQAIGVDAAGDAFVVWQQANGAATGIFANRYIHGVGWGNSVAVATDSVSNFESPRIAVDAHGDALAVWLKSESSVTTVSVNRYTPSGGWDSAISIQANLTGNATAEQVATDANGNALVIWQEANNNQSGIWANRYVVGRGWGTAVQIDSRIGNASNPQIAFDPSGRAYVAWEQVDGSSDNIWSTEFE